jgi:lysine N6-hydroxylase
VLGTGTPPHLPAGCRPLPGDAVHSSGYLPARARLRERDSIALVGGGQSAAEIFLDLLEDSDAHGYALTWITRSPRFFPLEYTKLTLEMTSPEYLEYFHRLPPPVRDDLVASQAQLYKGIDADLIDEIFHALYRRRRRGSARTRLLTNTELTGVRLDEATGRYDLDLRHTEQERAFGLSAAGLVLATGYRYEVPAFLDPVAERIRWDERGRFDVRRNYTIDVDARGIFVQNAELHTHGFVAPDLGMAAYRNSCIIRELLGREHYPVERSIAVQEFGVPAAAEAHV